MRWVPMGRFERTNRKLLALETCRDIAIFVGHTGSLRMPGVPQASQGRPWGVARACPGSQGRPWGVPGASLGVPGRPLWSQGRAQGIPGIPGSSGDVPGIPRILFHEDESVI